MIGRLSRWMRSLFCSIGFCILGGRVMIRLFGIGRGGLMRFLGVGSD